METNGVSYNRLFNTRIVNNYYESSFGNQDFDINPTGATALAMRNANMLFKNDTEGFRVYYKTNNADSDNAPSFIPFSNLSLVFEMSLKDTSRFANTINLDSISPAKTYAANNTVYFTNRLGPGTYPDTTVSDLSYRIIDLIKPSTFTFEFPQKAALTSDRGSIVIKNLNDATVTPSLPVSTNMLPNDQLKFLYDITPGALPNGYYKFTTTVTSQSNVDTYVYIDDSLAGKKTFGIIDILAKSADESVFPATAPGHLPPITSKRVYDTHFNRRDSYWKYILVLKSPAAAIGDTLTLVYPAAVQSPYPSSVTFSRTDLVTPFKVNNISAAVFLSSVRLPFYNVPKSGLLFKKDPGTGVVTVLSDLAGPNAGTVSAQQGNKDITEIYIYI